MTTRIALWCVQVRVGTAVDMTLENSAGHASLLLAANKYLVHCNAKLDKLTFRRRIKSRLPFAGIIRRLPYSTRFQDKG